MTSPGHARRVRTSSAATVTGTLVVVTSLLWLRLPVGFGLMPPLWARMLCLMPLALGLAMSAPRRSRLMTNAVVAPLLAIYVLVLAAAVLRGGQNGAYSTLSIAAGEVAYLLLFAGLGLAFFIGAMDFRERDRRLLAVALAPGLYVALNVLLHVAGVTTNDGAGEAGGVVGSPAQLLGFVGIDQGRVLFPLANGVNNFGDIAGAALVASALLLPLQGRSRPVAVIFCVTAILALLLTDARGALLLAVSVASGVALITRSRVAGRGLWVPGAILLACGLAALGIASNTGLVDVFSRSGGDLATGTNRVYIWQAVLNTLSEPRLEHLYGFGANGQIGSGAGLHYAYLFVGGGEAARYTAHNIILQSVLDVGYFGLAILLALFWSSGRQLYVFVANTRSTPATALFGVIVFLALVGFTDGAPSIYTPEALALFILIAAAAGSIDTRASRV